MRRAMRYVLGEMRRSIAARLKRTHAAALNATYRVAPEGIGGVGWVMIP